MDIIGFEERWGRLKELGDGKTRLIEDLIDAVHKLGDKFQDTESDLHLAQETNSRLFKDKKELTLELKQKQKEMDYKPFAVVLIDGDGMNLAGSLTYYKFLDDLVKGGESGGRDAAQRLRDSVTKHLRGNNPDLQHDLQIIVRVYANMRGLSKTYCDTGLLEQREDFDRFVRGFNMGHTFCNFIDAGNGKECSDDKMREDCKFHVSIPQCKHIVFGGSADNGYARLLGPYASDENISKRITMVEGPPFAPELSRLVHKFTETSFREVFRDTKVQGRSVSFTTDGIGLGSNKPTWATTVATKTTIPASTLTSEVAQKAEIEDFIPQNENGQRVDGPLKRFDPAAVDIRKLKARKLCNHFHLRDHCYNDKACQHEHGKLNGQELLALRHIARGNPCPNGTYCMDPACFSGHRCTHPHHYGIECRFPGEMHDVDTKVVNR